MTHCRCGEVATQVIDVHAQDGTLLERRLACDHCASNLPDGQRADQVVCKKDLQVVMGSDTCWCDGAKRLRIKLEICPQHGRFYR
jgi:transcriptional regulator NrdR family protein